ncbi:putative signal peptide protein [Puccinia sorghi]|uniref:Putative signal peptide protein n=1 Tax=Puccinia sorghi TaxID=27349 RepID=A0A0L6UBB4_9BASI|nr:putative signal peptide protein [Puccinia sorghi]
MSIIVSLSFFFFSFPQEKYLFCFFLMCVCVKGEVSCRKERHDRLGRYHQQLWPRLINLQPCARGSSVGMS